MEFLSQLPLPPSKVLPPTHVPPISSSPTDIVLSRRQRSAPSPFFPTPFSSRCPSPLPKFPLLPKSFAFPSFITSFPPLRLIRAAHPFHTLSPVVLKCLLLSRGG